MPAHFEIHAGDVARAKDFYQAVMGWTFEKMPGGEEIDYHLVKAADIGPGHTLTGGLFHRQDQAHPAGSAVRGCTLTFEVADADATYERALAEGGAEAMPPTDFPGIGRCAYMEDGEGNIFGVITPAGGDA